MFCKYLVYFNVNDHDTRMTYSGILAVIMVKVITTAYAISSWSEKDEDYEDLQEEIIKDAVNKKES